MKNVFAALIAMLLPASLGAADFGLMLDQTARAGGTTETAFEYQANVIPRFSSLLGDSGDFLLTAGITAGVENGDPYYVPELLRTELSWRFDATRFGAAKITAGRMHYAAPCAWLAEGLFDGLQFAYNSTAGSFNAGAWYTGLLYKKKANIIMTAEDTRRYYTKVDYDHFAETYGASKRMLAALGWEHPALAELVRAKLAVIAQTDLNGEDTHFHSQYLTARIGIPAGQFLFELGGALQLAETGDDDPGIGLAGELGIFWTLPTAFLSRLSFTGYFSSGRTDDADQSSGSMAAFVPITAQFCGSVLEANPAGMSTLTLDYIARLHRTFSLDLSSTYVIRGDRGTYTGYPVDDIENNEGFLLGNEFFARLIWSPVSDIQLNLGGGVFLPAMGNVAPDREPQWRIVLTALLALY